MSLKNLYKFSTVLVLLIIGIGCKRSTEQVERKYLTDAIGQTKVDDKIKWIVILPGLGCHGCIQEGEAFMRDQIQNRHILFVLTKVTSLKILQQKTGIKKIAEQPNIYIDRDESFNIPTDNSIYPCIIKVENGVIVSHEFQSPENSAVFGKLSSLALIQ